MKRALIVGIDEYPNSPLTGSVNDANKMYNILSKNQDGSSNFECKKLIAPQGSSLDLVNRPKLREHLEDLFVNKAEVALFYFSGHGALRRFEGFLVTQDATNYDEGVEMRYILNLTNTSSINEIVIILDCCYSGSLGSIPEVKDEHVLLKEGVSILTASRESQTAIEMSGAGVFTSKVYNALDGGAADILGNVNVASIYSYVDQILGAWDQRPLFKSYVSQLIPLRKCKPIIDLPLLRLLPEYFSSPTNEIKLDHSYEPTENPRDTEKEKIFGHLQKYRAARLLEPVGEEHMYFAAMNCKSCKLTPLGQFYWNLAQKGTL